MIGHKVHLLFGYLACFDRGEYELHCSSNKMGGSMGSKLSKTAGNSKDVMAQILFGLTKVSRVAQEGF